MDDTDSDNECTCAKDRSSSPTIKSTAVVKYTAVQSPAGYARLQCNTDLNLPPSNWSSAIDSYGLKQILASPGLSSFRMAHMFPDCVGEVDVISGAECIKKLLKLPYQPNGTISMMVHRIENTLLLDDAGIYDYLMKTEWPWLKHFFCDNILKTMSEQERLTVIQKQASGALQLTSKFLCHSVIENDEDKCLQPPAVTPMLEGPHLPEPEERAKASPNEHLYNRNVLWTFENIQMLIGTDLPIFGGKDRPCVSLRLRDSREPINVLTGIDYWLDNLMCNVPEVLMCYHIDGFVQKYEPMKTEDLPNLEGSRFSPKIVRNVAQNILAFLKANATKSGHTYWLFKGPHDDVVKLYDLTSLCGGFVASESVDNPFTTPVAMLLYRVARNMRMTNRSKHVKELLENALKLLSVERYPQIVASSHYMLADLYLPAMTNPANPDFQETSEQSSDEEGKEGDKKEDNDKVKEETTEVCDEYDGAFLLEEDEDSSECVLKGDNTLAVPLRASLSLKDMRKAVRPTYEQPKAKPANLGSSPPSRCGKALHHTLKGLLALHHVVITKAQEEERERLKRQIILEEQHPKMANPYEPIKMEYQPLNKKNQAKEHASRGRRRRRERKPSETKNFDIDNPSNIDKNAILIRRDSTVQSWHEPSRDDNFAWKLHLKTLLYEKICLAFATLAEHSYVNEQYGFSLKYIFMASKCQKFLSSTIIKSRIVEPGCLLGRVGDNYFQMSKQFNFMDKFEKQFETAHEIDKQLNAEIDKDLSEETVSESTTEAFDLNLSLPKNDLDAMVTSCDYYRRALKVSASEKRNELLRRLGSVNNELGVRYMSDAQASYMKYRSFLDSDKTQQEMKEMMKEFQDLSVKSSKCLDESTEIFDQVHDIPNLALLCCNKARFLRFKTFCDPNNTGFNTERRVMYNSAEELYLRALKLLEYRERCTTVWDLVRWELSSHTYTRATLLQDTGIQEPNEVAEAFKHALKFCDVNSGTKQYVYQFRAAMIYYKLASLYHKIFRDTPEDGTKRRLMCSQAKSNYEQAALLFALIEESTMYLSVQLEHVAVLENQAMNVPNLKLKSLQTALQLIRKCHSMIKYIQTRDPEENQPANPDDVTDMKSEHNLLGLLENRLHFILKHMIQYCKNKTNKDYDRMMELYKKVYCISLRIQKSSDIRTYATSFCQILEEMEIVFKDSDE